MSTAAEVGADMVDLAAAGRIRVAKTVVAYGALLQGAVKRHASQPRTAIRPRLGAAEGPRLLTGDYVRSINRRTVHHTTSSTTMVGSNDDRARRLEMGFVGTDSLGRNYDQADYPHYGPGLDEVAEPFRAALQVAIQPLPGDRKP